MRGWAVQKQRVALFTFCLLVDRLSEAFELVFKARYAAAAV